MQNNYVPSAAVCVLFDQCSSSSHASHQTFRKSSDHIGYLPVVKFDRNHVPSEERGEERDGEVMQLVDSHFHGCFGEHLCAHVERQTRLDKTSRHVCDGLITARVNPNRVCPSCVDALALGAEVLCQYFPTVCVWSDCQSDAISATTIYLNRVLLTSLDACAHNPMSRRPTFYGAF